MGYISYPIVSNVQTLLQDAYGYIKSRAPQWRENDGNLDTWLIQSVSTAASDLREMATDVPDTIFRYFGSTVLGIPPNSAVPAQVTSTWKAINQLGHLIPAGTLVGIRDRGGTMRGFRTTQDISILPGLNETDNGEVVLIAIEAGLASDNIGGSGVEAEAIDPLDFIDSVILDGLSSGGADAETVDQYNDRLAEFMRSLSTRPILPDDYARLAKNQPGIWRAVAIDGYNPDDDTYFNERMITIAAIDQFGLDLPQETKDDLDTLMQGMREVNFVINVIDASRTPINVYFEVAVIPGFSTTEVEAQCIAAVTEYLSPANWGWDRTTTGSGGSRTWVETQFLYHSEVASVISNVNGVDHIEMLTINRATDAPGTATVTLDVPAALTEPNDINGIALL